MVILITAVVVAHGGGFSAPGPGAGPVANTSDQLVDQPDEDTSPNSTNEAPTAAFAVEPQNPVTDQPVTLDASNSTDPNGSIITYTWDFDGDSTPDTTGEQVTHTFTDRGKYSITLIVTDNTGLTNETKQSVSISPDADTTNHPPAAEVSAEPTTTLVDEPVTLDASNSTDPDGDDLIYDWSVVSSSDDTDVDLPSGPRGEVSLSTPGEYEFRVTVSDGNTMDNATVTVTVRENDNDENGTDQSVTELDSCQPITEPGHYVLTRDIDDSEAATCIRIQSSNVTLDGAGHVIDGVSNAKSAGVRVRSPDESVLRNVTIVGVTITEWGVGIGTDRERLLNTRVVNNTIRLNGEGITVSEGGNVTVRGNTVRDNNDHGIYLLGFSPVTEVTENEVGSNGGDGIRLREVGSRARITNNVIENNGGDGLAVMDDLDDGRIANNRIASNGEHGIYVSTSDGVDTDGNTVSNNTGNGIIYSDTYGTIHGNQISKSGENGILLSGAYAGASGTDVIDNRVEDSAEWDLRSEHTFDDGESGVRNLSLSSATVSVDAGEDIAIRAATSPSDDPDGTQNIGQYVEVVSSDEEQGMSLWITYDEETLENANVTESSLELWHYQDGWTQIDDASTNDSRQNTIGGTVTGSGIVGVFANTSEREDTEHILELAAVDEEVNYRVEVSGHIERGNNYNERDVNADDEVGEDYADGVLRSDHDGDSFRFTGEIVNFSSDGLVRAWIDGERADPDSFGELNSTE